MRKSITLQTSDGKQLALRLDHWGGGIDKLYRRWSREPDGWHCTDTGEIAQLAGRSGWPLRFSRLKGRQ